MKDDEELINKQKRSYSSCFYAICSAILKGILSIGIITIRISIVIFLGV